MGINRWEEEAENWIAWARAPDHDAYHLYRDAFFELVPPPGWATLEIGCGEGRVARDLAARGHTVTGIDAAPTMLRAAAVAHPAGSYLVADAADLPFADGEFDLVVAYNALMDMAEMPAAVAEAARVLADDGRLCICVVHPIADGGQFAEPTAEAPFVLTGSYLEDRLPWYAGRAVERNGMRVTFHSGRYSLEQYARALEDAGMVLEALREPPVPAREVERDPSERRWRRVPNFLMIRAAKRPAGDR